MDAFRYSKPKLDNVIISLVLIFGGFQEGETAERSISSILLLAVRREAVFGIDEIFFNSPSKTFFKKPKV